METTPFITTAVKPLTLEDSVGFAKELFDETSFSHLPIVKNNTLIGLISEEELEEITEDDKELGYFQYAFKFFHTDENGNLIELLSLFSENNTNLIPVLNSESNYIGYFEIQDILDVYADTPFLKNEGFVVLLEKESFDYSMSQLCQIVESEKGMILGIFIAEINATTTKIALKISSKEINELLQSFRRYNYQVLSNHKEDFFMEELKERSNYLQKYLNI
ncbi:MAG: CBS domain-containing protein [Lutibacter sp.]|nr:CBS domain-containing protein [Lutibacter sp.]